MFNLFNSNHLSLKEYYENSLNQAKKSLGLAKIFAIIGLIWFIVGFGSVFNKNGKEKFISVTKRLDGLSEDLDQVKEKLRTGIVQLQVIKENENNESENIKYEIDNLANLIDEELKKLETLRGDIAVINIRVKGEFDTSTQALVVICLIGGVLMEVISAINFYQYGKVVSQVTEHLDTYQKFLLANNICNDLNDINTLKDKTRYELIKKFITGMPSADKQSKNNQDNPDIEDSNNDEDNPDTQESGDISTNKNGNN